MSESDSECTSYQSVVKTKSSRKPADENKKRKRRSPSSATPPNKKSMTTDIFGLSHNREPSSSQTEDLRRLISYFVSRVGNGCERRTGDTEGAFVVDCKVYKTEDARTTDSMELWKKALVRIKLQTDTDSPQWKALQKFVQSADTLFPDSPQFYNK